jgi:hypothetical protein
VFKVGDIVKSKWGIMHVIAHLDKDNIYFIEQNTIYAVDNNPKDWEIVDKTKLFNKGVNE